MFTAPADDLANANLEISRLKDIIKADKTTDAKTIRVEFGVPAGGRGWVLVVTDPIGDEQRLGDHIAGLLNLLASVVEAKQTEKIVKERDEALAKLAEPVSLLYECAYCGTQGVTTKGRIA
jgi:hypothetical protein